MDLWEYKAVEVAIDPNGKVGSTILGREPHSRVLRPLNELGAQGWEVIQIMQTKHGPNPSVLVAVMKRWVEQDTSNNAGLDAEAPKTQGAATTAPTGAASTAAASAALIEQERRREERRLRERRARERRAQERRAAQAKNSA